MIPPDGRFSGHGKLWEYYHFLIDFAPRVVYYMQNQTCTRTVLYVPGWYRNGYFMFRLSRTDRTMKPLADWLFSPWGGLRQVPYGPGKAPTSPDVVELPFHPHSSPPWSNQPKEWLHTFRAHAWRLAKAQAPPASAFEVLVVRRTNPNAVPGKPRQCFRPVYCNTGGARRSLPPAFFAAASAHLTRLNVSFSIVELAGRTLEDQVRLFAQATVVLGMHGAGLSNTVFSPPGAILVEYGLRANFCYQHLAAKMGLGYVHAQDGGKQYGAATHKAVAKAVATARRTFRLRSGGGS